MLVFAWRHCVLFVGDVQIVFSSVLICEAGFTYIYINSVDLVRALG